MTSKDETSKEIVVIASETFTRQYLDLLNKRDDSKFHYKRACSVQECMGYLKESSKKYVLPAHDNYLMMAGILNQKLGFPNPSLLSLVVLKNKNLSRTVLGKFGWFFGFNLDQSNERILNNVAHYPCMLKPTMLCAGRGSFCCEDEAALCSNLEAIRGDPVREDNSSFHSEVISILKQSSKPGLIEKCTEYMVEQYIDISADGTYQYCMEGFIGSDGKVVIYSLVEELFFKNGLLLGHVIPPVHFNGNFEPFEAFMKSVGKRMWDLGFQNQAFDIEFWQLPDGRFWIVEVNLRMASSYYDLYHLYSGNHIYDDVANLVLSGSEPEISPFSHLKLMWSNSQRNHTHSFLLGLTTRARGKIDDIFDIDFLQGYISNTCGFALVSRNDVLKEVHSSTLGGILANITIKGSWNDIVTEEKRFREALYKDKEQFYEADKYPDDFVKET